MGASAFHLSLMMTGKESDIIDRIFYMEEGLERLCSLICPHTGTSWAF